MVPCTGPSELRAGNPPAPSTLNGVCKYSSMPVSCTWYYGTIFSKGGCGFRHGFHCCKRELRRGVFWRQRRVVGHGLGSLGLYETGD